jgi:chromatin assembly factor 1 subunit A
VLKGTVSTVIIDKFTVRCLHATQTSTAAPVPETTTTTNTSSTQPALTAAKPRPSGPKIGFPTAHLAELYNLIHGNTNIKPDLISQLRKQFDETITSKAAIEAKVKEVAFREGKTKGCQWKVKPEAWVSIFL